MSLRRANAIGLRLQRRLQRKKPGYWGGGRERDDEKELSRLDSGLDLEVLHQGLGFLVEMTETQDTMARAEAVARCQELLQFELSMLPRLPQEDINIELRGTLHDFDLWVFTRVVQAILSGISPEEARPLWQPILSLPVAAHDWVRQFFVEWFRIGLQLKPPTFEPIWREMISYILASPMWNPSRKFGWFHVHDVVAEAMGLRSSSQTLGDASHQELVAGMAPVYQRWAETWAGRADLTTSFAYFLTTEAGGVLLPMGYRQIAANLDSFSDYDWSRERLTDALSAAIRAGWKKYGRALQADPALWNSFLTILNALCARSDDIALAIRNEVTRQNQ